MLGSEESNHSPEEVDRLCKQLGQFFNNGSTKFTFKVIRDKPGTPKEGVSDGMLGFLVTNWDFH